MKNEIKSIIEQNKIKLGIFFIVLFGTIATIYISPKNWLPSILMICSLESLEISDKNHYTIMGNSLFLENLC